MFFAETPKKETATRASCTQEEAKRCFRGGLKLGVHKIPFRVFSSNRETGKNRGLSRPQQVILVHYGLAKCSGRNLPAPHPAPPHQPAYMAASARAQRQQHRHVARPAPDRIRLERLSPPSFRDSWQGVRSEPDGLHHVHDRRQESASFSVSFPRERAASL